MRSGRGARVVTVHGVPIRAHWSWLPALGLLGWALTKHFSRAGAGGFEMLIASGLAAGLISVSILVHEIAHVLFARYEGAGIERVDLWIFGGVHTGPPPSPRTEAFAAAAGPVASALLAVVFVVAERACEGAGWLTRAEIASVLARFNALFTVFNIVPALPLDGGKLLRAWLRRGGGADDAAEASPARVGRWFGGLVAATGIARVVTGDATGGLTLAGAGVLFAWAAHDHLPGAAPPRGETAVPRSGARFASRAALAVVLLGAASALYHPPLGVASPGSAIDVLADIEIGGVAVHRPTGRYVAPSIVAKRATALHMFIALMRPGLRIMGRSELATAEEDPFRASGDLQESFRESRLHAAIAAAEAVGMEVTLHGSGARVVTATERARSAGIAPDDVIVAVDGRAVRLAHELRDRVADHPPGTEFRLEIERPGGRFPASLRSMLEPRSGSTPGLGVEVVTKDFRADLPFEIRFGQVRGAGGPSAGLAYALAIADMLDDRDLAAGRTVAATGLVDPTGRVDPIIGIIAKEASARRAGADVFVMADPDAVLLGSSQAEIVSGRSLKAVIAALLERA